MGRKIARAVLASVLFLYARDQISFAGQVDGTVITLERTGCYGICPSYKITILGDGTVQFEGKEFVRVKGEAKSRIDMAALESLVKEFVTINYFSLKDEYITIKRPDGTESIVTDLPSTITTFTFEGKRKEIIDYIGSPKELRKLERDIDTISNSKRWVSIDAETIREKCGQGWDVNSNEAKSLLGNAAMAGDVEVVQTFIQSGTNVKHGDYSKTLLGIASGKAVVEALISAGADVNGIKGKSVPPLVRAAELGDPDSIGILIRAGARVDGKSINGATALMSAAGTGVPESVRLLLSAGADPTEKDDEGESALDYARHGEERSASYELNPGPFSVALADYRAKFKEIKNLLVSAQQSHKPD